MAALGPLWNELVALVLAIVDTCPFNRTYLYSRCEVAWLLSLSCQFWGLILGTWSLERNPLCYALAIPGCCNSCHRLKQPLKYSNLCQGPAWFQEKGGVSHPWQPTTQCHWTLLSCSSASRPASHSVAYVDRVWWSEQLQEGVYCLSFGTYCR